MAIKLRISELVAVKARREKRRLTVRTIAHESGLGVSTVSRYMNNQIEQTDLKVLEKFCEYLKCNVSELFVMEDTEESEESSVPLPVW